MKLGFVGNFLAVVTLFLSLMVWSCKDEKDDPIPEVPVVAELNVSPITLSFSENGGEQFISITSNTTWKIDFAGVTWVRPSISVSMGSVNVKVTADANNLEEERTAVFKVTAEGVTDVTITITQAGKETEVNGEDPVFEEYIDPDNTGMRDLKSIDFAKMMTLGWNLGNSLEAITVNNGVYSGGETSWGNVPTTKPVIDAVKNAGFNTIRIPVAWSHKLVDIATHKISYAWLQRVEEVVNYALDNDMFVMINIHWDGAWLDRPFYTYQQENNEKLAAFWKQIAIHFRDYDDRLLFAGTNEVHVSGNYNPPSTENVVVQNSFNQTFVTTVRATGGRNAYRHLIVQAYNTNIGFAIDHMVMPQDNVNDRLMAEVHYYDPYEFALLQSGNVKTQWGQPFVGGDVNTWGQEDWVESQFNIMKTNFIDQGIPVILGEYGAILRANLLGEALTKHVEARNYYLEYVTRKAKEKGLVPVYWDNGATGNNGFGLFNRSNGNIVHPDALQAIVKGAAE